MEMVKKNMLSVVCGAIALVALIALAWPVSGMYADQQLVLDGQKKLDTDLTTLVKQPRYWPVIPEQQSGEKVPLKRFPNEETIKAGISIKAFVHEQAISMTRDIAAENRHELLMAGALPTPSDDQRFQFQKVYLTTVQDDYPKKGDISELRKMIKGVIPPTEVEIRAEADRLWKTKYEPNVVMVLGKPVNLQAVVDDWQKECVGLDTRVRVATAHKGNLYVEPGWLSIQPQLQVIGTSPKDPNIWYAQTMLWVESDILHAIMQLNGAAHNVEDAPVKHLFQIVIPGDQSMYTANPSAAAAAGSGAPPPALTDPPVKAFSVSSTGRVSGPLYDVIQFQLVMNVEASKVPMILAELQRGKLITVISADQASVNGITQGDLGFIYGNVPVTKLSIRAEEVLLREWTTKLMPVAVQQALQVPGAPAVAHP